MQGSKNQLKFTDIHKEILLILYKFRFASRNLIVQYMGLSSTTMTHYRLQDSCDAGYIFKHYSGKNKIAGKPASYCLTPRGMRILKTMPGLNHKALDNVYGDRTARPVFIDRCLVTFQLYNKLTELYGDDLEFYSKSEASKYKIFPRVLPDGYLIKGDKSYMLEWLPASTDYPVIRGRLNRLVDHYHSGNWKAAGTNYPTILFVCANGNIQRQVQKIAKRSIQRDEDIDFNDMPVYTSTIKALLGSANKDIPIWSNVEDPDDLITLQPTATS